MPVASVLVAVVTLAIRIAILPMVLVYRLERGERKRVWFQLCSDFVSVWPFQVGAIARNEWYRATLAAMGTNLRTKFGVAFVDPEARVGDNVHLSRFTNVCRVTLEDDVIVGHFCSLLSGRYHHPTDLSDTPTRLRYLPLESITIGARTYIGCNAVVMADVGKEAIIGAGTVVVKPVPDYAVVVGNPARIVRYRNQPKGAEPQPGATEPAPAPRGELVGAVPRAAG